MSEPDETPDLLANLRDGAWLDAQVFAPLTYAVPGVIPEGFTLLVGPPKIGKSWFVLACALAAASGGRALGCIVVDKRPVLYLALEDGDRRMQDRCRVLLENDRIPPGFTYLTFVMPREVVPTIGQWLERHNGAQPLVILDTLGKVMPPALLGESAYGRDYRIGSTLKRLADEHGAHMLVNHHDRKATSDDFVDSVSGTHGLAGSADTIVTLTRARHETEGLLKVTGRDVAEGEYALAFDTPGAWRLDGQSMTAAAGKAREVKVTAGLGDRSADVAAFVLSRPDGVRPAEVALKLGLDPATARTYLGRLLDAGRIARPTRGLYTPVASVASVALEDSDDLESNTSNTRNTPIGRCCEVCGLPLDPAIDATTHPACNPEGTADRECRECGRPFAGQIPADQLCRDCRQEPSP